MNAARRLLISAAVTAGVLGVGAGAFVACRQELSPGAQSGAAGAERRPSDAKYDNGDYDFYFKNGARVGGGCDGYNSEPGGKTTIYEYYQSEINKWEKRLKAAGIKPEVYRTSAPGKHCWVRFDTDLLSGVGYEGCGTTKRTFW
jgi:S-formylglutathione hydrolase FrmB